MAQFLFSKLAFSTGLLSLCTLTLALPGFVERYGRVIIAQQELQYICSVYSNTSSTLVIWKVDFCEDIVSSADTLECEGFSAQATGSIIGGCYTSTLTVTASPKLNGTVVRCITNDGSEVGRAAINIDEDPINLKACPVYDERAELITTECSWSNFLKQEIDTCYNLTKESNETLQTVPSCTSVCLEETCYDEIVETTATMCSVTLDALNVNVTTDCIADDSNIYFAVFIGENCGSVTCSHIAHCTFYSPINAPAYCKVDFTGPDGVTYTSVSTERGSAGDIVTVELTLNGTALLPNTTYSYQATVDDCNCPCSCVKTKSSYNTGVFNYGICSVSDLGGPAAVDGDPSVCVEGETPLFISGGTVCYTGTSPGSTAVYHCGEGHELVDGQKTRECQTSGEWSGIAPSCALIKTCSVSDLGDTAAIDGDPSVCVEGEASLFISGGTVCYTGTTPGSTAVYHCGEGHELVDGQKTRECQTSGEWSGIAPSCALIKTCSVSDLGDPATVDGEPSVCGEGETPLLINGGTVCYTGTTPGSTAVYHCGERYEASSESNLVTCQQSGLWNTSLECQQKTTPVLTIVIPIIVVFLIAVVVVVVVMVVVLKRHKKTKSLDVEEMELEGIDSSAGTRSGATPTTEGSNREPVQPDRSTSAGTRSGATPTTEGSNREPVQPDRSTSAGTRSGATPTTEGSNREPVQPDRSTSAGARSGATPTTEDSNREPDRGTSAGTGSGATPTTEGSNREPDRSTSAGTRSGATPTTEGSNREPDRSTSAGTGSGATPTTEGSNHETDSSTPNSANVRTQPEYSSHRSRQTSPPRVICEEYKFTEKHCYERIHDKISVRNKHGEKISKQSTVESGYAKGSRKHKRYYRDTFD